jgi:hypothetical protein
MRKQHNNRNHHGSTGIFTCIETTAASAHVKFSGSAADAKHERCIKRQIMVFEERKAVNVGDEPGMKGKKGGATVSYGSPPARLFMER